MAKTVSNVSTDIATLAPTDLVAILTEPEKFDDLIGRIRKEVEEFVPDLTTVSGRKAVASLAYKVARTKTALDDAGKDLNAGKRKEIDAVDAVRRDVRAKLDELAAEARKPLDEWEAKEAERAEHVANGMKFIDLQRTFDIGTTSEDFQARINRLNAYELDADVFQEGLEIAVNAKASALEFLGTALARAVQSETDAAELEAFRQREAGRIAREQAERDAEADRERERLAQEQRDREAEEAERKRLADIASAEQAAADAATAEVARVAQVEIDAANAEAETLRRAEAARVEEEDRIASETAAREADKAHRGAVMKAAKEAVMEHGGVDESAARKIVLAIVAGEIPNTRINF